MEVITNKQFPDGNFYDCYKGKKINNGSTIYVQFPDGETIQTVVFIERENNTSNDGRVCRKYRIYRAYILIPYHYLNLKLYLSDSLLCNILKKGEHGDYYD